MVPSMINKGKLAEIQSSTAAAECCKYSVEMSVEWQVLFFFCMAAEPEVSAHRMAEQFD